jgi:hypothetical protein
MTKPILLICPGCERHMHTSDAACPFCGTDLSEAVRESLALRAGGTRARLGRAALYALGVGTLSVTSGCGGVQTGGQADAGSGDAAEDEANFAPPYGQPPPFDSGPDVVGDDGGGTEGGD